MSARRGRAGFSFVEVLIVMTVLGIVAGLALPNLAAAIADADAARIVSDAHTVELAVQHFIQENGSLPRNSRWGEVPADLVPYLDDMAFRYKTTEYRLLRNARQGLVRLRVRYPRNDPIGVALADHRRPGVVTWTASRTDFYLERP